MFRFFLKVFGSLDFFLPRYFSIYVARSLSTLAILILFFRVHVCMYVRSDVHAIPRLRSLLHALHLGFGTSNWFDFSITVYGALVCVVFFLIYFGQIPSRYECFE